MDASGQSLEQVVSLARTDSVIIRFRLEQILLHLIEYTLIDYPLMPTRKTLVFVSDTTQVERVVKYGADRVTSKGLWPIQRNPIG